MDRIYCTHWLGFLMSANFYGVFLDAFVCGLIFGLAFHCIWNKKRYALKQIHLIPILTLPFFFLFIYLIAFPELFPSAAYSRTTICQKRYIKKYNTKIQDW